VNVSSGKNYNFSCKSDFCTICLPSRLSLTFLIKTIVVWVFIWKPYIHSWLKEMRAIFVVTALLLVWGCSPSTPATTAVIAKYANPPAQGSWPLVGDTVQFWKDVAVLADASSRGNSEAFEMLLVIQSFSDGAVAEGMPDTFSIAKENPRMAAKVINGNPRLKTHFGHWTKEL
jgi:hypothetical protein